MASPNHSPRVHSALTRLVLFDLRLTCRTGLHIGAGKSADFVGSDLPVIRDAAGQPLIPGSSLRGVLRAGAASLLEALGIPAASEKPLPRSPGERPTLEEAWGRWSWIDRLFGRIGGKDDLSFASRLQISDLHCLTPAEEPVAIELRDGVGIDREIRTASGGVKYDLEVVPAGTAFAGRVRLKNADDAEIGLFAQALWMLDEGLLTLGGKSARGLGWMQVEVTAPAERTAAEILARKAPSAENGAPVGSVETHFQPYLDRLRETIEARIEEVA